MSDFIFPHQPIPAKELFAAGDSEAIERFLQQNEHCRNGLHAQSPYCEAFRTAQDPLILGSLQQLPNSHRRQLSCVIDQFGEQTHALAEFYDRQLANLDLNTTSGLVGAGATASGARLTAFQRTMLEYKQALVDLSEYKYKGRAGVAGRIELESRARHKYAIMASHYRAELNRVARPEFRNKNRGHILNNADRGITLANHHRASKLSIDNVSQVQRLDRFARSVRYAGNGMVVLDAAGRLKSVYDSHERNENWQRELSREATGFGLGGASGMLAGQATVGALTMIGLGATPLGWVVVIGAGIAAGYSTATRMDSFGKWLADLIWNR